MDAGFFYKKITHYPTLPISSKIWYNWHMQSPHSYSRQQGRGASRGNNQRNNSFGASGRGGFRGRGDRRSGSAHSNFWNKEYQDPEHLALSEEAAEDLKKFTRWLVRNVEIANGNPLVAGSTVVDFGCGNGRNLVYLAKEFGVQGAGIDISSEAVKQAEQAAAEQGNLPLTFTTRSIAGEFPEFENESCDLALDMMTSHFLKAAQRDAFRNELVRIIKPGGWFFFKTFVSDGDLHTPRLLREHPADEPGAYIHPRLNVYEFVWSERGIIDFFGPHFEIHKTELSHKHIMHGRAFKRRTISVYMQKKMRE